MPLLCEADLSDIRIGSVRDLGVMSVIPVSCESGPLRFQLVSKNRLGEVQCLWEPSVFKGDGSEARKTIVFEVPNDVQSNIESIEDAIKKLLQPMHPRIGSIWHSSVKDKTLRSKIRLVAPRSCVFTSVDGEPIDQPEEWRRLQVLPILELKCVYEQANIARLIWEFVAMRVGECRQAELVHFAFE